MVKLIAALAEARDSVDVNIAYGEAVPRFARLRTAALVVLAVACLILFAAYVDLRNEVNQIQSRQVKAAMVRAEILHTNRAIKAQLLGQRWANAQR